MIFSKAFAEGLTPARNLTLSEWAELYLYNPPSNSNSGKFSVHRAPYQIEVMDALTPGNGIKEVVFMSGSQTGKTTIAICWQGFTFHINPQNFISYQPTEALAKIYAGSKVNPTIECTPVLNEIFQKGNGKNNLTSKEYKGGCSSEYKGAASATSFRMMSAPNIHADEIDSWESDLDGEGDPLKLLKARVSTFENTYKIFYSSTPTIQDFSSIEKKFKEGDQRYYHVPCPHCGVYQTLKFHQVKFLREEANKNSKGKVIKDSIYYECEICKEAITEDNKTYMLANGKWIAENPNAPSEIRSYHCSSLYSPLGWCSWFTMVSEFVDALDDPIAMKTFKNTRLAETYYEKSEQPSHYKLKNRAEDYNLYEVNEKAVVLFAGVDTQPDRLCIYVIAVGEEGETWSVAYEELTGSPEEPKVWEDLERIVKRPFKHKSGVDLFIKSCAIDTGGANTTAVYSFVRKNQDKYFAIKGASHDISVYIKESNRVDYDKKTGGKIVDPLILYLVNTHLIKKYIYLNLNMMLTSGKEEGPKVIHFSKELPDNFYEMLVAEKLVRKVVNGIYVEQWRKPKDSTRNEVLDCLVYAYSMAFMHQMAKLYGTTYDAVWDINIGKRLKIIEDKNNNVEKKVENKPQQKKSWINKGGWSLK